MRPSRTAVLAAVIVSFATPSAAWAACPNEDVMPAADNIAQVRESLLCLHNEQRAAGGLPALKENAKLRRAAAGHADDMVDRGYFSHTGRRSFVERIIAAGYARRDDGWALGENLAWGTGERATPRRMMEAWMNSPGHRRTVLNRAYREVGFGVRLGVPKDPSAGATVTANFGARP